MPDSNRCTQKQNVQYKLRSSYLQLTMNYMNTHIKMICVAVESCVLFAIVCLAVQSSGNVISATI